MTISRMAAKRSNPPSMVTSVGEPLRRRTTPAKSRTNSSYAAAMQQVTPKNRASVYPGDSSPSLTPRASRTNHPAAAATNATNNAIRVLINPISPVQSAMTR